MNWDSRETPNWDSMTYSLLAVALLDDFNMMWDLLPDSVDRNKLIFLYLETRRYKYYILNTTPKSS